MNAHQRLRVTSGSRRKRREISPESHHGRKSYRGQPLKKSVETLAVSTSPALSAMGHYCEVVNNLSGRIPRIDRKELKGKAYGI
jgi:hypothetical protein